VKSDLRANILVACRFGGRKSDFALLFTLFFILAAIKKGIERAKTLPVIIKSHCGARRVGRARHLQQQRCANQKGTEFPNFFRDVSRDPYAPAVFVKTFADWLCNSSRAPN